MVPEALKNVLTFDPEILGGAVCFKGTRVPVETLFDYQADGLPLDRFLQGYPTVTREQALTVLRWQSEQSRKMVAAA